MAYIGKTTDGFGVRNRFVYLASSGATSVSGADANGATLTFTDGAYVDVYLNGVLLKPTTDYNTSTANTIAGLSALNTNDEVTVVVYDVFTVADMVSATSGGTFSGAVIANNTLDMNGTELILDADGDSSIHSSTDDQIDIKVGGTDTAIVTADTVKIRSDNGALVFRRTTSETDIAKIQYVHGNPSLDIGGDGKNVRFINGSSFAETMRVGTNGNVTIQDGNLVIGTSGHGIDFSATSTSGQGSMTSELLDVYEEGTFTPAAGDYSGTMTFNTAYYTKIGRIVNFAFKMTGDGTSDDSQINITGFPYAVIDEHAVSLSFNTGDTASELPNAMVNSAEICYFYVASGSAFTYTMLGNGYVRVAGTYKTTN